MFKNFFNRKANKTHIDNGYYEVTTRHLRNSKYCEINSEEEKFIKAFIKKLEDNNLTKYLKLERTSRKDIHVFYASYPIGRIKLNGRKKWMMVNSSKLTKFEDLSLNQFIDSIDYWIVYIKRL